MILELGGPSAAAPQSVVHVPLKIRENIEIVLQIHIADGVVCEVINVNLSNQDRLITSIFHPMLFFLLNITTICGQRHSKVSE